jgi:putative ATP-dependent endonuclease of OLD family
MKIRQVKISNFRGIREMEWCNLETVNCLIGPRDSTKTTILDAIEYTLSSRWNIPFDDTDFYLCDPNNAIEITVTVGQVPEGLLSEQKLGLHMRGWNNVDGINDEPKEGDEHVLSVRLKVDQTLEPQWTVVNDREKDGTRISYKDRELLGVIRLGQEVDKHLSWIRGSILSQLTEDRTGASAMLANILRKARAFANFENIEDLTSIAQKAKLAASQLGVRPTADYKPAFDSKGITGGFGAICIHDGKIPLRLSGLGSRRLIALALQISCAEQGSILLIDEIENALEPYAIIHLLHVLQESVNKTKPSEGQVLMTSHSGIVVAELGVEKLKIARSINGKTKVQSVNSDLQATVRSVPEALLGRKILVCEGKTEYGICRSLDKHWTQRNGKSLAYMGVAMVEGGGIPHSSQRASRFAGLEYPCCLFIDSDKLNELKPSIHDLKAAGIVIVHWGDAVSTEERVAKDLCWEALKGIVSLLIEMQGEKSILDPICSKLNSNQSQMGTDLDRWRGMLAESEIRKALGLAAKEAKENKWFKRIDFGEELGDMIIKDWIHISDKDLGLKLQQLQKWIYD